MARLADLIKGRRGAVPAMSLAIILAVPIAIAATHQGYPVSTADLDPRTVWVTNARDALIGRLSRPIVELNGAAQAGSVVFDVFQDEHGTLLHDIDSGTLEKVDPAFVSLIGEAVLPLGAKVAYGGGAVAVWQPEDGSLWVLRADQPLDFSSEPIGKFGANSVVAVSESGTVFIYSPAEGELRSVPVDGGVIGTQKVEAPGDDLELTTVGERAVILAQDTNAMVFPDGSVREFDDDLLRAQQPGPAASSVLVSTGDALLVVPFDGGEPVAFSTESNSPASLPSSVAAPVRHGECVYAAWSHESVETHQCGESPPVTNPIAGVAAGDPLTFRVNRSVIVLNNIANGDSWAIDDDLTLVANWDEVKPESIDDSEGGDEQAANEAFEDDEAPRGEENTYPEARDDEFGARPSRPTVLPVLDNDIDADGDILTLLRVELDEALGSIELIDGGRSLQFKPASDVSGAVSGRYDISDGRGGSSSASFTVRVSDDGNEAPLQQRIASIKVEQGQSITYNVLADWRDPDGDEIYLARASAPGGDVVRRTPDGLVSFTHVTSEIGQKTLELDVVDDRGEVSTGTVYFSVRPADTIDPVGVPDFASGLVGQRISLKPLENDRSPSGGVLSVIGVELEEPGDGQALVTADNRIEFVASSVGVYYLRYGIGAGASTGTGLVRVDVVEDAGIPLPPIAVRDVAFLRPGQSVDLGVLQNDLSPSGRVIGVTSISLPVENTAVTVEVLKNTLLRISASEALTQGEPFRFDYTISDGLQEATATVVIVPVAPLATNQPPIPQNDSVTVRAGDAVSVSVLDNDVHPDGSPMSLVPEFAVPLDSNDGFAFVTGDEVRYQAPSTPGTYRLSYSVIDDFQQLAAAAVTFVVTADDEEANRAAQPVDVEARLFSGTQFRIDIPLDGIDPDGDSAVFVDPTSSPQFGVITDQGDDWFRYEASADAAGTDTFTYQVQDSFGATAQATVRIGVMPRPDLALPPSAVNDVVSLRPGRVGSVAALANDSDPSGLPLSLSSDLDVPEGIDARVVESQVVVETDEEGLFTIRYSISNGRGGTDSGFVVVSVDQSAPLLPPVGIDHRAESRGAIDVATVTIDPRAGAQNPGGLVSDLEVALVGPNASFAEVDDNGSVTVTRGDRQRVIAYSLTNEDGLTGTAFLIVPRLVTEPFLDPTLDSQIFEVESGQTRSWDINELVIVPSGRDALLVGPEEVEVLRGAPDLQPYVDGTTVSFRSEPGYAGIASVTFLVTDGTSSNDPNGRRALITLPLTVVGQIQADVAPVFATMTMSVVVGESAELNLRDATAHPDDEVVRSLRFGPELSGQTGAIGASLSGDVVRVTAGRGTTGETTTLGFTISGGGVDSIDASIQVIVVPSDRPLAQIQDDVVLAIRNEVVTILPLANDGNPFGADRPLRVVDAVVEDNGVSGVNSPTTTSNSVRLVPPSGFVGTISVRYTVEDDTGEESRHVSGRIEFVYRDVPGNTPSCPGPLQFGDMQIAVTITCAPPNNNAEIDGYRVRLVGGVTQSCEFNVPCVFGGLTNGISYCFEAQARNVIGWGAAWGAGCEVPLRAPAPPTLTATSDYDFIRLNWSLPNDGSGGVAEVRWQVAGESGARGPGGQPVVVPRAPGGPYQFQAQSCNRAGCSAMAVSNQVTVPERPPPPTATFSRGDAATLAIEGPANRIRVDFTNLAPGTYNFCGETHSDKIYWWQTFQPPGRTPGTAARVECATANLVGTSSQPFGWVLRDGASGVYVALRVFDMSNNLVMDWQSAHIW